MADYKRWNKSIIDYVTAGVPKGQAIFLSIDGEAIDDIAHQFLKDELESASAIDDFIRAVKKKCVIAGQGVSFRLLRGEKKGIPNGVGFLALLVYAATLMQEEEDIGDNNYFLRLHEVLLDNSAGVGRPDGMPPGSETSLWDSWNLFLADSGFLPTAEPGIGPQKYLRYIISQTILRECDKEYLADIMQDGQYPEHMDPHQLGFHLSRETLTRRHVREGILHPDPSRSWEFFAAAHRLYESVEPWKQKTSASRHLSTAQSRSLEAGLYRDIQLDGSVAYHLFPRQPHRSRMDGLSAQLNGQQYLLNILRPGFYCPLWQIHPFAEDATSIPLENAGALESIRFPKRDFWILTQDPENPVGAWGSWKRHVDIGEHFLLLSKPGVFDEQIDLLKQAKLINWQDRIVKEEWIEYEGCMVLSYDWGAFNPDPECQSLIDALTPRSLANISLSGGLRDPNQNAWIAGTGIQLSISGFEARFDVTVKSPDNAVVLEQEVLREETLELDQHLNEGHYRIEATTQGSLCATRTFRVIEWDQIQVDPNPGSIVNQSPISTAGLSLMGPIVVQSPGAFSEGVADG